MSSGSTPSMTAASAAISPRTAERSAPNSDSNTLSGRGRPDPDLVVMERRSTIGSDRIGTGHRVDALAIRIGVVRPDRFGDQHASPHALEQAGVQPHLPARVANHHLGPVPDAKSPGIVRMDHHLGTAAILRA